MSADEASPLGWAANEHFAGAYHQTRFTQRWITMNLRRRMSFKTSNAPLAAAWTREALHTTEVLI
jgi:hypothetical protein